MIAVAVAATGVKTSTANNSPGTDGACFGVDSSRPCTALLVLPAVRCGPDYLKREG